MDEFSIFFTLESGSTSFLSSSLWLIMFFSSGIGSKSGNTRGVLGLPIPEAYSGAGPIFSSFSLWALFSSSFLALSSRALAFLAAFDSASSAFSFWASVASRSLSFSFSSFFLFFLSSFSFLSSSLSLSFSYFLLSLSSCLFWASLSAFSALALSFSYLASSLALCFSSTSFSFLCLLRSFSSSRDSLDLRTPSFSSILMLSSLFLLHFSSKPFTADSSTRARRASRVRRTNRSPG